MKRIKSDKIIVGEELFDGYVYFENGQITEVTTKDIECETFDFSGKYIVSVSSFSVAKRGRV